MSKPEPPSMPAETILSASALECPEVRVHLAHLRALHHQRMNGINQPVLPRLKVKQIGKDALVPVRIKLAPEVLSAFKATGSGWQKRINEVLITLVGKGEASRGERVQ